MTGAYDAILIGAGHNTLAAALHLSARGWRVAAFEQAPVAGGAVKTGAYTLPGFRHDWAAMNLSLFAGSPFFKAYGPELMRHGLEFVPVSAPFGGLSGRGPASVRAAGQPDADACAWTVHASNAARQGPRRHA